jgi:hypothetical protein
MCRHVCLRAQVIPVKGMDIVAPSTGPGGEVYVASSAGDAGIRRLAPLPFGRQARALAERGEYPAALELASLMPASEARCWRLALHHMAM